MSTLPTQSFHLLAGQTRPIHASSGLRLQVVRGRLWLTQPHAAQDLFLGPGDRVDLLQDWVVIGADTGPTDAHSALRSEYLLSPLVEPKPGWFQRLRKSRMANRVWSGVSVIWWWPTGRTST